MPKPFIPPVDQINNLQPKKSKKTFSDDTRQGSSLLRQAKSLIRDSYAADMFEQVGALNAVVLEVIEGAPDQRAWKNSLTAYAHYVDKKLPDFMEVRFRVPELHAHLPSPKNSTDYAAINLHPIAIMIVDDTKPEVGDIIQLDFADKNNFRGAVVIKSLNSEGAPNASDECSPAETHNSAPPQMNVAPPSCDSQSTTQDNYSALTRPAENAQTHGIESGGALKYNDMHMFMVNKKNYENMSEFRNPEKTAEFLAAKDVYSVCIQVAENNILMLDYYKIKKISKNLREKNISVNFYVSATEEHSNAAIIHLAKIAKISYTRGIFYHGMGEYSESAAKNINEALYNFAKSSGITYGVFITEYEEDEDGVPTNYFISAEIRPDYTFISANNYDYSKTRLFEVPPYYRYLNKFPNINTLPLYHFGGINLVKTPDDPCVVGKRTAQMLFEDRGDFLREIEPRKDRYAFDNFDSLDENIASRLPGHTGFDEVLAAADSFLKSAHSLEKPPTDPPGIAGNTPQDAILPPSFNSSSGGTQIPAAVSTPSFASTPGSQCSPVGGAGAGGAPAGTYGGPGSSVPPEPSFRFDSIADFGDMLWTTDAGNIITDQIMWFMNNLSMKIYQQVPMTDIAVAGSYFKKVRCTSTTRTPEKQVQLMWDKIDHGGRSAITSLYGSEGWPMTVLDAYYAGKDWDRAVNSVKARIAYGGNGHLYGTGVDIHTRTHLEAEGIAASNASVATMMTSRYVRAVVQAAQEMGASPVVEAYQQHIHITFYPPPTPPVPKLIAYDYIWSWISPVLTWTRRPVGGGFTEYFSFTEEVIEDFQEFITLQAIDHESSAWVRFTDPGWFDDVQWYDVKFTWPST